MRLLRWLPTASILVVFIWADVTTASSVLVEPPTQVAIWRQRSMDQSLSPYSTGKGESLPGASLLRPQAPPETDPPTTPPTTEPPPPTTDTAFLSCRETPPTDPASMIECEQLRNSVNGRTFVTGALWFLLAFVALAVTLLVMRL